MPVTGMAFFMAGSSSPKSLRTTCTPTGIAVGNGISWVSCVHLTVLGEIPNRKDALKEIWTSLKPGDILSVTEVLPDPHYQRRSTVCRLSEEAGFRLENEHGTWVAYPLNSLK